MSRLADDLLVLARADQGRLPLRPRALCGARTSSQPRSGAPKPHSPRPDARSQRTRRLGRAVVLADPDRVAQALDNLVANSLRLRRRPG